MYTYSHNMVNSLYIAYKHKTYESTLQIHALAVLNSKLPPVTVKILC